MKKKMKKIILANKAREPTTVNVLWLHPRSFMKGKLYPPKYKVEITAEEINMLMYSAKR
jgi:hypothetical protein